MDYFDAYRKERELRVHFQKELETTRWEINQIRKNLKNLAKIDPRVRAYLQGSKVRVAPGDVPDADEGVD